MVSLKRATTSCLVQKEKTQTRITFNNLSANLTVNDLYKYVQLHLEEDRPFELSLVCGGSDGDLDSNASSSSASLKVSLEDKKQKTLLAAGLSFENGAANTVVLTSAPGPPVDQKSPSNGNVRLQKNGFKEPAHKEQQQQQQTARGETPPPLVMGVPHEQMETATNGTQPPTEAVPTNGHATQPAEELNDFSRQITINTNTKIPDMDDDPAPLISPIEDSPSFAAAEASSSAGGIPEPPPLPALEYHHPSTSMAGASSSNGGGLRRQTSPGPSSSSSSPKFVGLVNQAMTCYLNSLLQALYMTPEFRNAMYNWEFDGEDESKSIPYQLQRLFLNLQTSPKSAVETTDLTRSFGWDSSEAWQQHDIQELCRVMFDALEHKFKNTKESNLINRLYEGKMIDYLKCLSCGTEKQREDTFLDIPLPVKPFGSTVAFGSIEEALRAFIQPEILNGNNQYSCEKCQKKCDAHKGLKFSKFPYILTLHLKRFDFDYQTFHRIKLNDKVTFPQTLNLNGFVNTATDFAESNGDTATNGHQNGHSPMEVDEEDEEAEGVKGRKMESEDRNGDEKQQQEKGEEEEEAAEGKTNGSTFGSHSGPYLYELFAIMIHSGSASGGHYYVYIKDFDSGNWFCFNDQCVSPITQEDIQKSFGGSAGRYHYSGAYTTSTNAYMMMYRQCDPVRNTPAPTRVEDLPEHIQQLQKRLRDRQEVDNRRRNNTDCTVITTRVYHYDRERCKLGDVKIHISGDSLIDELLQRAYDRMSLATLRSLNLCRLVAFDSRTETTLASIEHHDQTMLQDVLDKHSRCDFLLEERDRDEKFRSYGGPAVNARVYLVDLQRGDVDGPHRVPVQLTGTVAEMKQELRNVLKNQCVGGLRVAVAKGNLAVVLDDDKDVLQHEIDASELCPVKLFVARFGEGAESRKEKFDRHLKRIVERFDRVLSLYLKVPQISAESRKMHAIPDYVAPRPVEESTPVAVVVDAQASPVVVVKVEEAEPVEEIAPVIQTPLPDAKALSPTPEPTSSASNRESLSSPSPEPEVGKPKEGSPAEVKVAKKKSLVPKAAGDAAKSKEKSPVKTIETTKEITENGVTRRVKVIKRIVKKDPAKKAAVAATEASTEKAATSPTTAAAAGETLAPTKRIVKKTKVATTSSAKEAAVESPGKVAAPALPDEQPKTNGAVGEPVTEPLALPKVEVVLPADQFAFLDVDQELSPPGKYFRAIQKSKTLAEQNGLIADDELRLIQVHVDKNMTISMLKMCLEPVLEVSKEYFKINRSRTETLRLNEPVSNMSDGDECLIELGRILLDGEYKYRVCHMKLSAVTDYAEDYEFLCDFIVKNGQRVDEVKQNILGHLRNVDNKTVGGSGPEKFRLWMKLYQNLSQVCTDEVVMGEDVSLRKSGEIVLEELEEGVSDLMADTEDYVVFIRKWNPDTLVLESYQSMALPLKSDLLQRISERSGIPTENLEYARNMAPFPKMKISRANINADMDWKAEPIVTSYDSARSGQVYFYRDKTVSPKELTAEEIAGIQQEETKKREEAKAAMNGGTGAAAGGGGGDGGTEHGSSRDNATASVGLAEGGSSSSYTAVNKNRRKERALKIYLDSSPAKVAS